MDVFFKVTQNLPKLRSQLLFQNVKIFFRKIWTPSSISFEIARCLIILLIATCLPLNANGQGKFDSPVAGNVVWTPPYNFPDNFKLGSRMLLARDGESIKISTLTDVNGRMEYVNNRPINVKGAFAVIIPDFYSPKNEKGEFCVRINVGSYEICLPDMVVVKEGNFSAPLFSFPDHSYKERYYLPWAYIRLVNFPQEVIEIKSSCAPIAGWVSFDGTYIYPTDQSLSQMRVDLIQSQVKEVYIPVIADQVYDLEFLHSSGKLSEKDIRLKEGEVHDIVFNVNGGKPVPTPDPMDENDKTENPADNGGKTENDNSSVGTEEKTEEQDKSSGYGYEEQIHRKKIRRDKKELDEQRKIRLNKWIEERTAQQKEFASKKYDNRLDIVDVGKSLWKTMDNVLPEMTPRVLGIDAYIFQKGYDIEYPDPLNPGKTYVPSQLKAALINDWRKIHEPPRGVTRYPRFRLWFTEEKEHMTYFFNSYKNVLSEPLSAIIYKNDPRVYKKGKSSKYCEVKSAAKRLPFVIDGCDSLKVLEINGSRITDLTIANCGQLRSVILWGNQLETLNIINCPALESVDATINNLHSFEIKNCPNVYDLKVPNNKLKNIDLSGLPKLEYLDVSLNDMQFLNVGVNKRLRFLLCVNNLIKKLDISGLECLEILSCAANDNIMLFSDSWAGGRSQGVDEFLKDFSDYPWLWKWNVTGQHKVVPAKELKKVWSDPFDWTRVKIFPHALSSSK